MTKRERALLALADAGAISKETAIQCAAVAAASGLKPNTAYDALVAHLHRGLVLCWVDVEPWRPVRRYWLSGQGVLAVQAVCLRDGRPVPTSCKVDLGTFAATPDDELAPLGVEVASSELCSGCAKGGPGSTRYAHALGCPKAPLTGRGATWLCEHCGERFPPKVEHSCLPPGSVRIDHDTGTVTGCAACLGSSGPHAPECLDGL